MDISATVQAPDGANADTAFMAVSGQPFTLNVAIANHGSDTISVEDTELILETAKTHQSEHNHAKQEIAAGKEAGIRLTLTPAADAAYTRPYWHRDNPETDSVNKIDDPQYLTLPLPPSPATVHVHYSVRGLHGEAVATAMVKFREDGAEHQRPVAVAPAFSVAIEPSSSVIPATERDGDFDVVVPAFRRDVSIEDDLVEEIARVWGYDKIPSTLPSGSLALTRRPRHMVARDTVRRALTGTGCQETVSLSLTDPAYLRHLELSPDDPRVVRLQNPLAVVVAVWLLLPTV